MLSSDVKKFEFMGLNKIKQFGKYQGGYKKGRSTIN